MVPLRTPFRCIEQFGLESRKEQFCEATAQEVGSVLITSITAVEPARTGAELVAFFRDSPFAGEELTFQRDQSEARTVDFD